MRLFRNLAITSSLGLLALVVPASASTLNDQCLATPGYYNGSGNPNCGFVVATENFGAGQVEIGLRTKHRQDGSVIHTDDHYAVPTGPQDGAHLAYAYWNYEFSINLNSALTGLDFSNSTTLLTITDLDNGQTATVAPTTYWLDNASLGPGMAQNSENPVFGNFPLAASFNMNRNTTYQFDLVTRVGGDILASATMYTVVGTGTELPEPGTIVMMLGSLGALSFYVRRRKA